MHKKCNKISILFDQILVFSLEIVFYKKEIFIDRNENIHKDINICWERLLFK